MERREADGEGGTQEPGAKSSRLSRDKASEELGRRGGGEDERQRELPLKEGQFYFLYTFPPFFILL